MGLFILSSVDGYLDCFQVGPIMSEAVVNCVEHTHFTCFSFTVGGIMALGPLGPVSSFINWRAVFPNTGFIYTPSYIFPRKCDVFFWCKMSQSLTSSFPNISSNQKMYPKMSLWLEERKPSLQVTFLGPISSLALGWRTVPGKVWLGATGALDSSGADCNLACIIVLHRCCRRHQDHTNDRTSSLG